MNEETATMTGLRVTFRLRDAPTVEQRRGNGVMVVQPTLAEVTYTGPHCLVSISGHALRKDGVQGKHTQYVGWRLAPTRDADVPPLADELEQQARAALLDAGAHMVEVPRP